MRFSIVVVFMLAACQQSKRPWVECSHLSEYQLMRFVIQHDGTMTYRGGVDVIAEQNTWECTLSSEDVLSVTNILSTLSPEQSSDSVQTVMVNGQEMFGTHQSEALFNELRRIAMRRFDTVIDGLPKPSADVIIERSIEGQRFEQEEHQSAE